MDIKNAAIGAKVVIESLICLLENEGIDISSIKFKVGNDSGDDESPEIEFQKLIDVTLNELDELKTQALEGFVLVPKKTNDDITYGILDKVFSCSFCHDSPESWGRSYEKIIESVSGSIIEAQEQSHDQ